MLNSYGSYFDLKEQFGMDMKIYNQRILNILDKTINRVHTVSLLTELATNPDSILHQAISSEVANEIQQIKNRYEKKKPEDQYYTDQITKEEVTWKREEWSEQIDNQLARVLLYLEDNQQLKRLLVTNDVKDSPHVGLFLKCFQELRNSLEQRQKENLAQEKAREKYVRRCHVKNDQAKKEIAMLEEELAAKKSDLNASIIGKNLMIKRHQGKIEKIQMATKEAIDRIVAEVEEAIKTDQANSAQIQQALQEELDEYTEKYNDLLKEHISLEKQLRAQRTKVENQLATFMQKFDQDMSEKQAEEENLYAEFENEKRKYEEIQKKLDEQEEEYDELMQEKTVYEQELLEQKLFIFILNRSARRIQRAFHAYKLRKLAKKSKKGKKGKGKKK